jgi:hypothetical protein
MMTAWLIKAASAISMPSRLVPECYPTGATSTMPGCDTCFLVQMGYNVLMLLVYAAFIIVAIMAIVGGLRMLLSGGNAGMITAARKQITFAIVGLAIVLLSWVGLNLLFTTFTNLGGRWYILEGLECTDTYNECMRLCDERYPPADYGTTNTNCKAGCPTAR